MFEKKKKHGERKRYWLRLMLLLAIYSVGFGGAVLVYLSRLPGNAPLYPAPPQRIEIQIEANVLYIVGDDATPQSFRNLIINTQVPSGTPGGGFEIKHAIPGTTNFAGSAFADTASTGCVWGYLEIEGYPHYDFEFGMNNIDFGAKVELSFMFDGTEIDAFPSISPAAIKPALAPDPLIHPECAEQ